MFYYLNILLVSKLKAGLQTKLEINMKKHYKRMYIFGEIL